jgi:WD40 repeat protein
MAWHPIHESLLVSGGYNGSIAYWIVGQEHQSPHSKVEDAHRQSIDLIAWHPSGHLLATASHDCILKFWCREPPGSKLELPVNESLQENPPNYMFGPITHSHPNVTDDADYEEEDDWEVRRKKEDAKLLLQITGSGNAQHQQQQSSSSGHQQSHPSAGSYGPPSSQSGRFERHERGERSSHHHHQHQQQQHSNPRKRHHGE